MNRSETSSIFELDDGGAVVEPGFRGGGVRETGVGGANSITAANGNLIQPTTLHHIYSLSVFHQQWDGKRRQTSHGMFSVRWAEL